VLDTPTPPIPTVVVVDVDVDDDVDIDDDEGDEDGFSNAAINDVLGDVGDDTDVDDNNDDAPTLPPSVVGVLDCDPPNNEVAIFNNSREAGTR